MKLSYFIILSCIIISFNCAPEQNETTTRGHLHALIVESTAPAMVEEVNQFMNLHEKDGADITYEVVSSEEAIRRMVQDTVRFIISTRPLTAEERRRAAAVAGFDLDEVIIAYDGIVAVVNHANPMLELTVTDLQRILDGTDTRWEQVSKAAGMRGKIDLLYQDSSDVSMFARDRILQGHSVRKDARNTKSSIETLRLVASQPASIGLVGVSGSTRHTWLQKF